MTPTPLIKALQVAEQLLKKMLPLSQRRSWPASWSLFVISKAATLSMFFKTNYIGNILRQVQVFENGRRLKYDHSHSHDQFGQIGQIPLNRNKMATHRILQSDFEQEWAFPADNRS